MSVEFGFMLFLILHIEFPLFLFISVSANHFANHKFTSSIFLNIFFPSFICFPAILLLFGWPLIRGKSKAWFNTRLKNCRIIIYYLISATETVNLTLKVKREILIMKISAFSFAFLVLVLFSQQNLSEGKRLIRIERWCTRKIGNHLKRQRIFHESLKLFEISSQRVCFVDQRKVVWICHGRKAAAKKFWFLKTLNYSLAVSYQVWKNCFALLYTEKKRKKKLKPFF